MGLDLTFLPFDSDNSNMSFSHTVLWCGQDYDLFDWIKTLPQLEVPLNFTSYVSRQAGEDTQYGITTEMPYGEPVKYTTVKHLTVVPELIKQNFDPVTRAIWAYFGELEGSRKVALFWH